MTVFMPPISLLRLPRVPVWVSRGSPRRTATARPRPTQAAATVPVMGLPVMPQMTARSMRPPSRGRPGRRLKAATRRLEIIRPHEEDAGDGGGVDGLHAEVEESGEGEGEEGADEGEDEFAAGGLGFLLDLGDSAEELELDAAHREFEAEGGDGVREFVDEDGGVEGDGEEEGDEVADGAEVGQDPVELVAEDPGDEGGDEEPAGRDVDGHAEGAAHEESAARVGAAVGALAGLVGVCHGCPSFGAVRRVGSVGGSHCGSRAVGVRNGVVWWRGVMLRSCSARGSASMVRTGCR